MNHSVLGLHHVTRRSTRPSRTWISSGGRWAFAWSRKTVNFDNHDVYHFYYGTEIGAPGTIWTTFPYGGRGVPAAGMAPGQIGATSFSVPEGSLVSGRIV